MEKSIVVVSNAESESTENSLANFSNKIPVDYFSEHVDWCMSVETAGIDFRLKNPACPTSNKFPSFYQINRYYLEKTCEIK